MIESKIDPMMTEASDDETEAPVVAPVARPEVIVMFILPVVIVMFMVVPVVAIFPEVIVMFIEVPVVAMAPETPVSPVVKKTVEVE